MMKKCSSKVIKFISAGTTLCCAWPVILFAQNAAVSDELSLIKNKTI